MRDPVWMSGDDIALGLDECDECGYAHDIDEECIEEDDPDSLHDEMGEIW